MSFGSVPTNSSSIPLGSVYTPNTANSDLTALEGGPISTDGNSQKSAPASMYVKDGANVTQGTSTDANTANTVMGRLTKIRDVLLAGVAVTGTFWQATQPVSAASLPLPTGASTVAKQPALGTAGSAASDVLSVQGITSMTPLKTDNSGVTQPVSGTVTANAGTNLNTSALALETGGHLATVDTSTSNTSTALGTKTDTKATDGTVTAWSVVALLKGIIDKLLSTLAVTQSGTWTVQPGNTANTTAWKVDGSAVTQPVSGTITANAGTNLNTSTLALESGGNLATLAGVVSSSKAAVKATSGDFADGAVTAIGTTTQTKATDATTTSWSVIQLLKGILNALLTTIGVTQSGTWTVQPGNTANTTAWKVDGSAVTQPVSGTVTANAGTNMSTASLALETGGNLATLVTNTTGLATDAHATTTATNTTTIAGAITSSVVQSNTKQINGTTISVNAGTVDGGSQRVIQGSAATGTKSNVASSASSVTVLASNTSRKQAMVYNESTAILYLDLTGGTASATSYSTQVGAQAMFELPGPSIYNGAITGIWATANGNARVTEWT